MKTDLFNARVKLAIGEDAGVEVLLGSVAEVLVLLEDLLEEVTYAVELLISCIFVSVNFILHLGLPGGDGNATHDVKKRRTERKVPY
jgi:hypothetical protein